MPTRRFLSSLALLAALASACAGPPDKEMQQAQAAIDAAKAAGADRYAPDDFNAARDALKLADDAVTQRDYRLALNHALDARERAQSATKDTVERKAAVRVEAERFMASVGPALSEAHVRLTAAEAARISPRTLAEARHTISGIDLAVQKAGAARDRGDYLDVVELLKPALPRLQAVAKDLEAATPGAARRRR
ncbi:MAG TPA: DUF4398 domain-containing protein [Vicinamibacterales bacterium]|jgi:hypothetical protein